MLKEMPLYSVINFFRQYWQYLFCLLLIAYLFVLMDLRNILVIFSSINYSLICLAGLCYFFNNILMTLRIKKILSLLNQKIRFKFAFFAHMGGMILSDVTPARSGYLGVPFFLKRRGIQYEKGLASITSSYIYDFLFKLGLALVSIIFIYSYYFRESIFFVTIATLMIITALIFLYALLIYQPTVIRNLGMRYTCTSKLLHAGNECKKIQKIVPYIIIISIFGWILRGFEWFSILLAINVNSISLLDCMMLNPLITLFSFIPITPAGIGLQEGITVGLFSLLGVSTSLALSFAIIVRLLETGIDLIGIKDILFQQNEGLKKFYNSIPGDIDYQSYNSDLLVQRYFQHRRTKEIINRLNVSQNDVILDIGCGSGVQISEMLLYSPRKIIGMDLNYNALKFAKKLNVSSTDYIMGNAEFLPFRDNYFDKIVCAEIIEHLPHPEKLIEEIKRVVTSSGSIVITTPNEFSLWGVYEFFWDHFGRGRNYGETHLHFFNPKEINNFFIGFSVNKVDTIFFGSPLVALLNKESYVKIMEKIDYIVEKCLFGLIIIIYAKK